MVVHVAVRFHLLLTRASMYWQDYRERVLRHEAAHFLYAPSIKLGALFGTGCMHA